MSCTCGSTCDLLICDALGRAGPEDKDNKEELSGLYSNRSAALLGIEAHASALQDAKQCVRLAPEWPKAYSRLGAALLAAGNWAVTCCLHI